MLAAILLVAVTISFWGLVGSREPMDLHVAHNQRSLTTTSADGRLGNAFTLRIQNRDREDHDFHIRIEEAELAKLGNLELVPGMPAEVFIQTGERLAISYLTKPLLETFAKAFKDG